MFFKTVMNAIVMTLTMHWLTLWATKEVLGYRIRYTSLLKASVVAGFIDAVIIVLLRLGYIRAYAAIPLAVLSILPAVRISFGPVPLNKFVIISCHVLGISILAFGGASSIAYLSGYRLIPTLLGLLGTILITTEIGWGFVRRRFQEWLFYVPIEIYFGDIHFEVNALIDTGNRLKDPLTGSPVVLLEYNTAAKFLPEEVKRAFMAFDAGDLGLISELLENSTWLPRFRVIPFVSIGEEKGLLPGFRADKILILDKVRDFSAKNVVIGIHISKLSEEGTFSALLHPDVLAKAS
ncbi:MAG: sigma-E processing peptidase SpoIIGA [Firmicutes bacterium]|jgi:stage II sporulation protein GA (sporulation sigma-E factor processing peptidase)|nr:sigma-E processing peptidase SpoIIGA [Bacillota bacterium]